MFNKWWQFVTVLAISLFLIMVLGDYNYCQSQSKTPPIRKDTMRSLIAEFKALASEMKENGNRRKAQRLLIEAILELNDIKRKSKLTKSNDRSEEMKKSQFSVNSPKPPSSLEIKTNVTTIPISTHKVRVVDTFPLDTSTISNNTLQNFHYYELNAKDGAVVLKINFPVIVQEYPYSDFEFQNNKAFGATESSEGIIGYSKSEINSRFDTIIKIMSQAGIGLARDFKAYDTIRSNIEPKKGGYNFSRSDYAVNAAIDNGIDFIGRLTLHHVRKEAGPPKDESTYIDYIKQTVGRYKGRVKYWQTLKEPEPRIRPVGGNDKGLFPEDVVRILELSYTTIKSVDNDAIVYFPGTGPLFEFGGYNVDSYFEKIISLGGAKYFDVLGFSAYKSDVEEQAEKHRNILKKYGYDKPLWVAQTGAPDIAFTKKSQGRSFQGGSSMAQCEFMVKVYARAFAIGAEKVFWGEFIDESQKEKRKKTIKSKDRVLMWESTGLFYTGTWRVKPGYFTHRLLASALYGFDNVEKVAPNIVKFTFAKRSTVYLVWPD